MEESTPEVLTGEDEDVTMGLAFTELNREKLEAIFSTEDLDERIRSVEGDVGVWGFLVCGVRSS